MKVRSNYLFRWKRWAMESWSC